MFSIVGKSTSVKAYAYLLSELFLNIVKKIIDNLIKTPAR